MKHANLTQLIEAREGNLAQASSHIEGCEHCQSEINAINDLVDQLRSLPNDSEPKSTWSDVLARSYRHQSVKNSKIARSIYSLAASVAFLALCNLYAAFLPRENVITPALADLQIESRILEYIVASHENSFNLNSHQKFKIDQIQWRLMMLDMELREAEHTGMEIDASELWRQRVTYLHELQKLYSSQTHVHTSANHGRLL